MTEDQAAAEVRLAYARLFNDNPRKGDGAIVLADMARRSGFYGVPSIAAWIKEFGTAEGHEINCHELNGKRALFATVSSFASLTETEMLKLERIARFGFAED
jgi:hypothetical protein